MVRSSMIASAILMAAAGYASAYPTDTLAPLFHSPSAEAISDSYIVVLKQHVDETTARTHSDWVQSFHKRDALQDYLDADAAAGIQFTYATQAWRGYAGKFNKDALQRIRGSPEVAYVERDSMVYASELQRNAPWGLARISHRDSLSLRTFNKYPHEGNGGEDVKVFVIDTGINIDHHDFEGRASWGATIPDGDDDKDGNGHGSHCAGTIAGKRFGVAKKAMPVAVKVLRSNGSGSMSGVLAGVNWAIEQHQLDVTQAKTKGKRHKGAVANMSLGGGKSRALDAAVNEAVRNGIVFAVAAGNDNSDACDYSPAAAEEAITVGASTLADERASFSNYGRCVDVFAPGENIMSVWRGSPSATNTISGTSMAAPHVAGLAAYFISQEKGQVTPRQIKEKILSISTRGHLSKLPKDTPNLLIFNSASEADI